MKPRPPRIRLTQRDAAKEWTYYFCLRGKRYRKSSGETDKNKAYKVAENALLRALKASSADNMLKSFLFASGLFREYNAHLKEKGRSETSTLANYERYADRFLEYFGNNIVLGEEIKRHDIEKWSLWLQKQKVKSWKGKELNKTLSPKTVREHLAWLSSVYKYFDMPNPVRNVERPKQSQAETVEKFKVYTSSEIRTMLEEASKLAEESKSFTDKRTKQDTWLLFSLWLHLYSYTGCRLGELLNLRFQDIDHHARVISVVCNKTKHRRRLNLSEEGGVSNAWEVLMQIKTLAEKHYGDDFSSESTLMYKYKNWFYRTMKVFLKKELPKRGVNIKWKTVHGLRHSFASNALIRMNWNVNYLAKWLGHDVGICFKIYGHLIEEPPPAFKY